MDDRDLLEDLRQVGQVDSVGRFTLDAAKAREKMKRYQLSDPHHYVLQVVQSAVAGGALSLEIRVDADDCWMDFDAPPPDETELRNLFNHLFGSGTAPRERSLRALATGLNSALALDPSEIRLDAWNGVQGWTLRMDSQGEQVQPCAAPAGQAPGVRIHVRRRHTWQVLGRFLRGFVTLHPEARALHDRCRRSPIPIRVNGRPVEPAGPPGDCLLQVEVEGESYRAVLALPRRLFERSLVEVVMDGVSLEARPVDLGPLAVEVVVWSTHLTRNVSQTAVAEDASWRALLVELRRHVRAMLGQLAGLCREPSRSGAGTSDPALGGGISPEITAHLLRAMVRQGLRADQDWRRWKELKQALLDVPVFPLAGGGYASLRALLVQYESLGCTSLRPLLVQLKGLDRLSGPDDSDVAGTPVSLLEGPYAAVLNSVFPQESRRVRPARPARYPGQAGSDPPLRRPLAVPRAPQEAPPPDEDVAAPPPRRAGSAPTPEEGRLLASLQTVLRRLSGPGHPELSAEFVDGLELGQTPPGVVWSCSPGGRHATLNRDHPLVRRLRGQGPELRPEVYALVSALYTALSRSAPGLATSRGWSFHAGLVAATLDHPEARG